MLALMHLVVIGGGPHGLAVLSALADRGSWPERVTVVDPHAGWCSAWDEKLGRLDLDRLRSPQVHHPGVSPMGFRDMVEALPEDDQLALRRPEDERAPTPAGMRRYLDELAANLGPVDWVQGTATHLAVGDRATSDAQPAPAVSAGAERFAVRIMPLNHAHHDVPANPGNGELTLTADAVVLAHNPSMPRLPEWARPLVAQGLAQHASEVDVRTAPVEGRDVLIVGGGLTAACLALESLRRGAHPTMLARRPLRARPYDVDASWIGPRRLAPYLRATAAARRDLVDEARDGGTIPPRTLALLRAAADDPHTPLTLREGVDVQQAVAERLAADAVPAPLLWLATGFEQDLTRDPLLAPVAASLGVVVHRGLPEVDEHLRLGGAPLYVAGPYAALGVGPACRNLAGARPAAQRIASDLAAMLDEAPV